METALLTMKKELRKLKSEVSPKEVEKLYQYGKGFK